MEFRKMVMITLYARQQKRHRCIEQSFGLCGRGRGWDDLREWHWNLYNILCEMNRQSRLAAWYRMLRFGALGWPRGMVWREVGAGFRMQNACTPVADSCWCVAKPIQYCKVISIQLNKFILKKKKKEMKRIQAQNVDLRTITVKELPEPLGIHPHWQTPLWISMPFLQWRPAKRSGGGTRIWLNLTKDLKWSCSLCWCEQRFYLSLNLVWFFKYMMSCE